ncbi:2,3-bisphosphoglycerate-independent phosphoglycerate mutase [Dankookia sp. GCM10030260]|uniref:2,3-bisphosphoglycerate-independent phosphoglycerate mutase n=1 Tax=Dankookia sp. GCM10030260 TaxID=3273390 RepID=UPI00360E68CC
MPQPRPVMLVILDGWGWREDPADNAVRQARTPNFDALWDAGPRAFLHTSGHEVGLPDGQMGNSEVGHLNLGAGRVVMQDLPRIDAAVADGSIARLPALTDLVAKLRASGGTCHLMGLLSPGGVHSHQKHAAALAKAVAAAGVPVALHLLTDGRDTPPRAAPGYLRTLLADLGDGLGEAGGIRIATVTGRYYAMDRDNRWERVSQAYDVMVSARGAAAADPVAAVEAAHARDITDEFIPATVIGDYAGMRDGDGLLCFNFRADRVREILGALLDPGFQGFARTKVVRFAAAAGLTQYSTALDPFLGTLFPPNQLKDILGEVVARAGRTQLRMAETEKYPHVTYFLNGGEERPYEGEDRIMVPSPKVATYDLQPEMSAPELADKAVAAIDSGRYDLIVLNFANPDMVGHTGVLAAAIRAVETVDAGLGRIAAAVRRQGGALLVTADHGNCEMMRDPETGGPHTAHTTNPVPVLLMGGPAGARLHEGKLADVAPTLLRLMGLPQPAAMTGKALVV